MRGKRGLSPLIATVLLIGFAVALGVMIMSITNPLVSSSCSDITIKTTNFCKEGSKLFAITQGSEGVSRCENLFIETDKIEMSCPVQR